jgi:hypothetical protein
MSNLSTEGVIDYLDRPPKRYNRMGSALIESPTGECVMFADMDLYMFEGGQLMLRMVEKDKQQLAVIERLRAALTEISKDNFLYRSTQIAIQALK